MILARIRARAYRFACLAALLTLSGIAPRVLVAASMAPSFPSNFIWGVATAAHQTEGGNTQNDWWEWEQQCHLPRCETSGIATDSYHRYDEDLALTQELGLGAFRLSVEWSRLEPTAGKYSAAEFAHYRNVLQAARARGLKIVLTLQHFTLPLWIAHHAPQGANSWLDPALPRLFERFTEKVVGELGAYVDYWITVNEPNVNILTSYAVGVTPPGVQNLKKAPIALAGFLKAHALAYHAIHRALPGAKVGFAHHMRVFDPYRSYNPLDQLAVGVLHEFWNHQFLRAIQTGRIHFQVGTVFNHREDYPLARGTLDFIGVNYYTRDLIKRDISTPQGFVIQPNKKALKSDMGWEIYPFGMYRVLMDLKPYKLPVLIAENGLADAADSMRARFICDHLREVRRAMKAGVRVLGYLHWSIIDNFEWISGRGPRFGLAEIDYTTLERRLRPSAYVYSRIAREGNLDVCAR